ncbi:MULTISPECIES: hypothetical protein [unclassified Bradyrhizobium]
MKAISRLLVGVIDELSTETNAWNAPGAQPSTKSLIVLVAWQSDLTAPARTDRAIAMSSPTPRAGANGQSI